MEWYRNLLSGTSSPAQSGFPPIFAGKSVALVGRFASGSQAEVARVLAQLGAQVVPRVYPSVHYLIVGEGEPVGRQSLAAGESWKSGAVGTEGGNRPFVLSESDLWAWVGLLRLREESVSLFTLTTVAELAGVERWLLRRWIHLGLLRPKCWVFRAPYLDYGEMVLARRLGGYLRSGLSWRELESSLWRLAFQAEKLGAQLRDYRLICLGKTLFLEGPEGTFDSHGQRWFLPPAGSDVSGEQSANSAEGSSRDPPVGETATEQLRKFRGAEASESLRETLCLQPWAAGLDVQANRVHDGVGPASLAEEEAESAQVDVPVNLPKQFRRFFRTGGGDPAAEGSDSVGGVDPLLLRLVEFLGGPPGELAPQATTRSSKVPVREFLGESSGDLSQAIEAQRVRLAACGPDAEGCFVLAELLYRAGQLEAARERYWMAIELDENFVEARTNLACVLVELGQWELAEAALRGATELQPDFPEAHWHLAMLLDKLGRGNEALYHWAEYRRLAPDSPWAAVAEARLQAERKPGALLHELSKE